MHDSKRVRLLLALPTLLIAWIYFGPSTSAVTPAPGLALAGSLGVVEGNVVDALTKEPLSAANILLTVEDTELSYGAMSDSTGHFQLMVPAGNYTMKTLLLGYAAVERELEVASGWNDPLRIEMEVTVVRHFDTFTVEGAALMVEVKETEFSQGIGMGDRSDYAVDGVKEAVARQAGVSSGNGELHVRGGRSGEISFEIAEVISDDFDVPPPAGALRTGRPPVRSIESLLAEHDSEIWIIKKAQSAVVPVADRPGCGTLRHWDESTREWIPIPLQHTQVDARVDAYISSVRVVQNFANPFATKIDVEYVFPLPTDAAVQEFVMQVGERRIHGVIREREEAERLYQIARLAGRRAALLEQERPNVFVQNIANLEPGQAIDIELQYFGTLEYVDGWYEWTFPMVVGPRYNPPGTRDGIGAMPRGEGGRSRQSTVVEYLAPGDRNGHDIGLTLSLDPGVTIEELRSVHHAIDTTQEDGGRTTVVLSSNDTIPNRDFVLRFRVAGRTIKSNLLAHRDGEGGYFSLMLIPPNEFALADRRPVEFVFVLDCSGSMGGWPIETAKNAARRALRKLRPDDSFQIIRFSTSASQLGPATLPATAENVEIGLSYLDQLRGMGGTHVIEGIRAALQFPRDPARMRVVSFMTDGYIGNEDEILRAVHHLRGDTRIFSFGVGKAPNRYLLEGLAKLGGGAVAYVGGDQDADTIDRFYERVRHPSLRELAIDWNGLEVRELSPAELPELIAGRPILICGRFAGELPDHVAVRGRRHGEELRLEIPIQSAEAPAIASVWARAQIEMLSRRAIEEPEFESRTPILELSLEHRLLSQFSSFLAIDEESDTGESMGTLMRVPVQVPEGVRYEATVPDRGGH